MNKIHKLNDLLDVLICKEQQIKSEIIIHQRTARLATVQIQISKQKLNQNIERVKTIRNQIVKSHKYYTI